MKWFVATLLVAASSVDAQVQPLPPNERLENIPIAQCSVQRVHTVQYLEALNNLALMAEQEMRALDAMKQVDAKATNRKRPLIEQLSKEDMQRLGQIEQQLNAIALTKLIESKRERDVDVLLQQVQFADAEYRWGTRPSEGTPEFKVYAPMALLRLLRDKEELDLAPLLQTKCSMDYALGKMQQDEVTGPLAKLEPAMKEMRAWSDGIVAKYNVKTLSEAKLSPTDQAMYDKYNAEVLQPIKRARIYLRDLQDLRQMAKAADILYDADRRDAALAVGDASQVGNTIERRVNAGEFDENMKVALGLWRKINEQIPPPILKQWELLKQVKEAAEKAYPIQPK